MCMEMLHVLYVCVHLPGIAWMSGPPLNHLHSWRQARADPDIADDLTGETPLMEAGSSHSFLDFESFFGFDGFAVYPLKVFESESFS